MITVEQENKVSQQCVKEIRKAVESGKTHLDSIIMADVKLFEKI